MRSCEVLCLDPESRSSPRSEARDQGHYIIFHLKFNTHYASASSSALREMLLACTKSSAIAQWQTDSPSSKTAWTKLHPPTLTLIHCHLADHHRC